MGQHRRDAAGRERKRIRPEPDFIAGFHTFGLFWGPGGDCLVRRRGRAVRPVRNIPTEEMHVLVNLAVGGEAAGEPAAITRFPSRMEVDYMRVGEDWRRLRR